MGNRELRYPSRRDDWRKLDCGRWVRSYERRAALHHRRWRSGKTAPTTQGAQVTMAAFEEIQVGQKACLRRVIREEDVVAFAEATGDRNPVHFDDDYAARTPFKGRIVHGMLTAGLISALLAGELPGPGTIYLEQHLRFLQPVRIGDAITADGSPVLDGEAVVLIPQLAR